MTEKARELSLQEHIRLVERRYLRETSDSEGSDSRGIVAFLSLVLCYVGTIVAAYMHVWAGLAAFIVGMYFAQRGLGQWARFDARRRYMTWTATPDELRKVLKA